MTSLFSIGRVILYALLRLIFFIVPTCLTRISKQDFVGKAIHSLCISAILSIRQINTRLLCRYQTLIYLLFLPRMANAIAIQNLTSWFVPNNLLQQEWTERFLHLFYTMFLCMVISRLFPTFFRRLCVDMTHSTFFTPHVTTSLMVADTAEFTSALEAGSKLRVVCT